MWRAHSLPQVVPVPKWWSLACPGGQIGQHGAPRPAVHRVGPAHPLVLISGSPPPLASGHCAVVREGLTNPWIPDNWSWGGVASEHCPVLAEFYAEKDWSKRDGPRTGGGVAVERADASVKHER